MLLLDMSSASYRRPACLSIGDCFHFIEGVAGSLPAEAVHQHLDDCDACRTMVAEAVRATVGGETAASRPVLRVLADGERVADRYAIQRFVARGGMGEVYDAVDTVLGGRVALKTFAVTTSDHGDAAEALLREVRIARKVVHPNVCRILELGIHRWGPSPGEAIPFLTMDFLDGETLAQRIARGPRFDPSEVARLVLGLAAGLGAVHRAGIVHRDFKSENVFLVGQNDGERPVVMDFGLARMFAGASAGRSSNGGRLVGTAAYMAPEQLTNLPTTTAADVFALGVVIFEMLTGRLPFAGDSVAALALSRLHQTAPSPSSIRPELDTAWDSITRRCLEREPQHRFASVEELAAAIEVLGRDTAPRRAPRRPVWVWAGAIGVVAIAGVVSVAPLLRQRNTEASTVERSPPATAPHVALPTQTTVPTTAPTRVPTMLPEPPALRAAPALEAKAASRRTSIRAAEQHRSARPPTSPSTPTTATPSPGRAPVEVDPLKPAPPRPWHPDDLANPF